MDSSPYSPPNEEYYYRDRLSATATPSPRGPHGGHGYFYPSGSQTPARPATRAVYGHSRNSSSTAYEFMTARPSPRYTSDGYYATANVSGSHSHKPSSYSAQSPSPAPPPRPHSTRDDMYAPASRSTRRNSFVFTRSSTPHGESDEEVLEVNGRTYVLPSEPRYRSSTSMGIRPSHLAADLPSSSSKYYFEVAGERDTDHYIYKQGGVTFDARDAPAYESSSRARETAATPRPSQPRRTSASIPTRPQTARPASSHGSKKTPSNTCAAAPASTPKAPKATEADAKKHRIPPGYSLKNWDPTESPILLLGSVFDANSLGKWIYDWTVYAQGPTHPISEIAGDMWLLLIQLAGKIRRAEDVLPKVRTKDNQEIMEEFLESGERLMEKLRKLLKTCEEPMLKSAKKNSSLGKNAGIEFVETLFGRDRVLDKTEKFMQGVRTFNLRFDANCDDIIKNPTL